LLGTAANSSATVRLPCTGHARPEARLRQERRAHRGEPGVASTTDHLAPPRPPAPTANTPPPPRIACTPRASDSSCRRRPAYTALSVSVSRPAGAIRARADGQHIGSRTRQGTSASAAGIGSGSRARNRRGLKSSRNTAETRRIAGVSADICGEWLPENARKYRGKSFTADN
jgi:hypothetical protein